MRKKYKYISINGVTKRLHRYVMEQYLGRELEDWEIVHHKDGDPLNNHISNLELTTRPIHAPLHHNGEIRIPQDRRCCKCGSTKTYIHPTRKRANWFVIDKLKGLYQCKACYDIKFDPYKRILCACGCGQLTSGKIISETGTYSKYISGHNNPRGWKMLGNV